VGAARAEAKRDKSTGITRRAMTVRTKGTTVLGVVCRRMGTDFREEKPVYIQQISFTPDHLVWFACRTLLSLKVPTTVLA
jgi:hypothetical protein